MSNHSSQRPSGRLDVGDRTERNEVPAGLRYPTKPPTTVPGAGAAVPARARVPHTVAPQTKSPSMAPMTLEPEPARQVAPTRRPRATPAPIEPAASRSNVIPFLRPNQPVSMVVSGKQPAPTAHNITRAMPGQASAPPASQSQIMRAAVMISHPAQNGQPAQMTAAAVFSTPNGSHVAVAMPAMQQAPQAPAPYFPPAAPAQAQPAAPPLVHDLPSSAVVQKPWADYEKLGLGQQALAAVHQKTSKLVVSAYRLLGFFILTLIVALLVGYITESIFYFISDSWIEPMVVSKGDDKMVALSSALAAQENARDRIASDLNQAEQAIARQQEFQQQFMATIKADLGGRKLVLGKLRGIAGQYANAGASVNGTNSAYAASERARMQKEYAAGLIDRRAMMAGNFQGAQITTSSLGIAEKRVETEARADELAMQVSSLEAILADKDASGVLSYEILKIKQEYDNSKLEMNKAIANRDSLKSSLERQDEIVKGLSGSSFLKALKDNASVAFVPYGNMKGVTAGANLYGCKLGMVVCHKVGKVIQILPGEIQQKHPHRDKMLRGQLVEVQIEDGAAAQDDVLFVGGKPMLF